ncbi:hypothetical protein [Arthrobacter sp. Marseille-P9274]|uniref:hypothetical protein n=1 Tax=Arthrobacter sp. Marseille-P9274 TaxID=2866572 RepID=UPI0021C9B9F2|nr:hypothetical protein [Arthrobacter sp. Marseille-P9274]
MKRRFEGQTIFLPDLVSNRANRIHDVTAVDCLLQGPLKILGSPDITGRNFFLGDPEEIVTSDMTSVFIPWNCDFQFCTFENVTLAVPVRN